MALSGSFMSSPARGINDANMAMDIQGLDSIKTQARTDRDGALRQVSQQFEAMFMNMVMKSMREATKSLNEDSFLNTQHTEFFQEMHDDQLVQNMTQSGGLGLADALYDQLSQPERQPTGNSVPVVPLNMDGRRTLPGRQPVESAEPVNGLSAPDADRPDEAPVVSDSPADKQTAFDSPAEFVQSLMPAATKVADEIGADPRYLLAQAALETGWGKKVIGHRDGSSSHNLFNIKADERWSGPSARVLTREFLGGRPVQVEDDFRSYDSFADSFADYQDFLRASPRYRDALNVADDGAAYAEALQSAGYATDPAYAEKIRRIADSPLLNQHDLARTR